MCVLVSHQMTQKIETYICLMSHQIKCSAHRHILVFTTLPAHGAERTTLCLMVKVKVFVPQLLMTVKDMTKMKILVSNVKVLLLTSDVVRKIPIKVPFFMSEMIVRLHD